MKRIWVKDKFIDIDQPNLDYRIIKVLHKETKKDLFLGLSDDINGFVATGKTERELIENIPIVIKEQFEFERKDVNVSLTGLYDGYSLWNIYFNR